MSEEEANQLKELYKKHIVESVLGENKFGKTVDKLYFDSTDFIMPKALRKILLLVIRMPQLKRCTSILLHWKAKKNSLGS